jgi:ubiquinone/menaquinone biosynthesis C-methylase UbiE
MLSTPLPWNLVSKNYAIQSVDHFVLYAKDALGLVVFDPDNRVLDVAAGPGSLSLEAAKIVTRVDAVDFSPAMLAELERRKDAAGLTNIVVQHADGQALPFDDETFDAAFSMFGLIFFPDRALGFSEMHRTLKLGGAAVISTWQPMDKIRIFGAVFEALGGAIPEMPQSGPAPLTSADEIRAEMAAAGFSDIDVIPTAHAIEVPDISTMWSGMRKTFAPIVLLEHKMGTEDFEPIARQIEAELVREFKGPIRVEMPAWLGRGTRR